MLYDGKIGALFVHLDYDEFMMTVTPFGVCRRSRHRWGAAFDIPLLCSKSYLRLQCVLNLFEIGTGDTLVSDQGVTLCLPNRAVCWKIEVYKVFVKKSYFNSNPAHPVPRPINAMVQDRRS